MQDLNVEEFHLQVNDLLQIIKQKIYKKIHETFSENNLKIQNKKDKTIVTDIDLYISDLFKKEFLDKFAFLHFFSEEDQGDWNFPIIILDPIDGTKELANGVGECAVSFGIYFSNEFNDSRNFSWIYNPFTAFEISSTDKIIDNNIIYDNSLVSFVSRSEYQKGLHQNKNDIFFFPKGSIAFKLGLLASGGSNFIITKKPKNIWDIAAGTHICLKHGIFLFQNGTQVKYINNELYQNTLIWTPLKFKNRLMLL